MITQSTNRYNNMKVKPSSFYWNIIASMGWAEATLGDNILDTEDMKRDFMETYSEQVAVDFREWYNAKYNELVTAYDAATKESGKRYGNYGGDDSFGDMLDHVMGLGETYYCSVMADFELLNKLDVVESFSYCIPYTGENLNDYEDLKGSTHQVRAEKALKNIVANAIDVEMPPESLVAMGETMRRLTLILAGKYDDAVGDLDFKKDYNKFYGYKGCENGAQYANTLFDAKKYMTK